VITNDHEKYFFLGMAVKVIPYEGHSRSLRVNGDGYEYIVMQHMIAVIF